MTDGHMCPDCQGFKAADARRCRPCAYHARRAGARVVTAQVAEHLPCLRCGQPIPLGRSSLRYCSQFCGDRHHMQQVRWQRALEAYWPVWQAKRTLRSVA